ncbi:MAG: alpha/beta fold hydrolase [Pseudomonadota bacterium]
MSSALLVNLRSASNNPNRRVDLEPRCHHKAIGRRNRYVFLVHGFAVSEAGARHAYWEYARALGGLDYDADFHWTTLKPIGVTWPGDTPSSLPMGNQANYAFRVRDGIESGRVFGGYLATLRAQHDVWQPEIVLIGHSLGCRLILEALETFADRNGDLTKVRVCLMAAATPEGLVAGPVDPEETKLERAFAGVRFSYVAYSLNDLVLQTAFEPGQFWARNLIKDASKRDIRAPGKRTRAIGRRGLPKVAAGTRIQRRIGHGEYWKDSVVAKSFAKCVLNPKYATELQCKSHPEDRSILARMIPDRFIESYLGRNRLWSRGFH